MLSVLLSLFVTLKHLLASWKVFNSSEAALRWGVSQQAWKTEPEDSEPEDYNLIEGNTELEEYHQETDEEYYEEEGLTDQI